MEQINLVEISKIKLEPGEVLSVKLMGDTFSEYDTGTLREHLSGFFPNNKVMIFVLPEGNDLQFDVIAPQQPAVEQA